MYGFTSASTGWAFAEAEETVLTAGLIYQLRPRLGLTISGKYSSSSGVSMGSWKIWNGIGEMMLTYPLYTYCKFLIALNNNVWPCFSLNRVGFCRSRRNRAHSKSHSSSDLDWASHSLASIQALMKHQGFMEDME